MILKSGIRYTEYAIMALFPQNAEDAVQAAIATLQRLRQNGVVGTWLRPVSTETERSGAGHAASLQIGVGLHTGNLMLGIVGEKERMQGDIFSDAVNLTSRIEGLSKLYGVSIVVSENTLSLMPHRDSYHTRFLGKIQVVGKREFVPLFEIYDGDPAEIIELKLKTKADFEEGLHLYFAKEFAEAAPRFKNVLKTNSDDKTAKLYLERSAQFMVQGVPEEWEGVEAVESK